MRIGRLHLRLLPARRARSAPQAAAELVFRCNVCGAGQRQRVRDLERERASCDHCGSNVRFRGLMAALSERLFGHVAPIVELPATKGLHGIGMTDWTGYADVLAHKFSYTNSYLHKAPVLDVLAPDAAHLGRYDFVVSSDVFEHVAAPVQRAFDNVHRMLKPGGAFVFTVPYLASARTVEHFGEMASYRIEETAQGRQLRATHHDGRETVHRDLVFHGGDGQTLEMRVFGLEDLVLHLESAGFRDIRVHDRPCYDYGILHDGPDSLPISAVREPMPARPAA
ncbi:class I SAM-dependent methyltransferase [Luteimonas sp. Y-2-2-4F]|nr:methyltransferase domain-containing protein [Luteimonas sp. Y-2-2-4F]MCD9033197.1 class I SAM-dependent methyltransferase [Luteimonas sp. Y-2-2-4F]